MATLTTLRTAGASIQAAFRNNLNQSPARPASGATRPGFLVVLLRALACMAV